VEGRSWDWKGRERAEGARVENTYLLPRSRRINLFVGGAVRFLGRYYTRDGNNARFDRAFVDE